MSLDIKINHNKLNNSPLQGAESANYDFSHLSVENLVEDLTVAPPSCFLISGYRGSGKSSFINQVQFRAEKKDKKTLFIHLNFVRYETRTILLRKLIRSFYMHLKIAVDTKRIDVNSDFNAIYEKFTDLYERTFFEVSHNTNKKQSSKENRSMKIGGNVKKILISLVPISAAAASASQLILQKFGPFALLIFFGIMAITSFVTISTNIEASTETTTESSKNSFYDDEIAEYHLMETLKSLSAYIKPIFILDELDKVEKSELVTKLLTELKPVMLSGHASFIAVAGQDLFYRYFNAKNNDDDPLTSLFSSTFHVPLTSSVSLRSLFEKIAQNTSTLSAQEKKTKDHFVNYLILESKQVPRTFISIIRQRLTWNNGNAFLTITEPDSELEIFTKILTGIDKTKDKLITPAGHQSPIRDYLNMQLFMLGYAISKNQNLKLTSGITFERRG